MQSNKTEQNGCFCKKQAEKTLQFCSSGKAQSLQMYTFFTTKKDDPT
jgi:hypothetical protein